MQQEHLNKIQRIALDLNKNGLSYLSNQHQSSSAFDYFKQAEKMLHGESKLSPDSKKLQQLLAVTYNNLAIYYKRTHKPKAALTYLKNALQLETFQLEDWLATASTHLNICAIYSFMKKHKDATEHALLSIQMAEKAQKERPQDKMVQKSCQSVSLASRYNLAVEYEHLKRYDEALEAYRLVKQKGQELGKNSFSQKSDQSIKRISQTVRQNRRHILELMLKKKENQEKGHYDSMCRNKKNFRSSGQDSNVQVRFKRYDLYSDSKRGAQSMEKLRKSKPIPTQGNQESKIHQKQSFPDIRLRQSNVSRTRKNRP